MEAQIDPQIHVLNNFQIFIPLSGDADTFVFTQTTSPSFGLTLTRTDTRESYHYQIQMLPSNDLSDEPLLNGLSWAKRTPYQFQKKQNTSIIEALVCRLKITTGVFDFRRVKQRSIRFVVRCFANDTLLSTGVSQQCRIFPKKRLAEEDNDDNVNAIVPISWMLDSSVESTSHLQQAEAQYYSSPEQYHDEDSVMANFNESEDRLQSYSNEGDSEDLSLVPSSDVHYVLMEPEQSSENQSDHYMVLYNGNAEVIGNFRALNFYKASDINIKEDVRLLIDDRDPRSVLLKIDGVEYKFKQGATNAPMNKRFVGYIAQQIESVVPEAVQLIDGILHVDYESLIPYLSESIKQNFRDISDMKAEASQIHKIVDMMYAEFIKKDQKKHEKSPKARETVTRRTKLMRWIIGTSLTVLALISVAIAVAFIVPLTHSTPESGTNHPSAPSQEPQSPSNPEQAIPDPPPLESLDQDVILELYNATAGVKWQGKVSLSQPVCEWLGVTCDTNLRVVKLELLDMNLQGTLPESIGKLDQLQYLRLSSSFLTGTIPAAIGNLSNLEALDLAFNQFTGTVPLEIFSLTSLKTLTLNYAYGLSWTIPPQISNLKYLESFSARASGLHGTLPNEISQLKNLKVLGLGQNQLTGTIPSLAQTNITQLSLLRNQFTGPVPKVNPFDNGLPLETKSVVFDISSNSFTGEFHLPSQWLGSQTVDVFVSIVNNDFTSLSPELQERNMTSNWESCRAGGVPFTCPIPDWFRTSCRAKCVN